MFHDQRFILRVVCIAGFFTTALAHAEIYQLMPAAKLQQIKAALPEVAYQDLQDVLTDERTFWYDDEVMTPSYQDSVGANANDSWPDLVAASETVIRGLFNRNHLRWQFPFGTTAGTDNSTNLQMVNFVSLPHRNGQVQTMPITIVRRNANRPQWNWTYPPGTVFGEILFIRDGANLLPAEIRTRKRYSSGWAMNAFRPFPTAASLVESIKDLRPDYQSRPSLVRLINFLENPTTLQPKTLAATAALADTFRQEGWIDPLPDFGDDQLVRELLQMTPFQAAYNTVWKRNGAKKSFAASTTQSLSIVPNHYDAGLLQVTDEACMRCHQETGRLVSEFYGALYLYGELWGKDGIFSFHPWDESRYPYLRRQGNGPGGMADNRRLNDDLRRMRIFSMNHQEAAPQLREKSKELARADTDLDDITYSRDIRPILNANCSECHTRGARSPDLTVFPFYTSDNIDQDQIVRKILVMVGSSRPMMPPGVRTHLTAQEIATIRAWQDGGLKP